MPSAATRTAGPQGTYTGVIVSLLRTAGRFRRSEGGQERQSYERMSCKRTAYRMARQLRRPPENPEPSLDGPHTGLGSIRAARTIKINNGAASEARTTHEGKSEATLHTSLHRKARRSKPGGGSATQCPDALGALACRLPLAAGTLRPARAEPGAQRRNCRDRNRADSASTTLARRS